MKQQTLAMASGFERYSKKTRRKKLVADLSLDKQVLQSVIRKNGWSS